MELEDKINQIIVNQRHIIMQNARMLSVHETYLEHITDRPLSKTRADELINELSDSNCESARLVGEIETRWG